MDTLMSDRMSHFFFSLSFSFETFLFLILYIEAEKQWITTGSPRYMFLKSLHLEVTFAIKNILTAATTGKSVLLIQGEISKLRYIYLRRYSGLSLHQIRS